jgi:hypothetical protein
MKQSLCALLVFAGLSYAAYPKKADKGEADPAGVKMLSAARAARASWRDFPGFSADLEVNVDGKKVKGKVTVSGKGEVQITLEGDQRTWARRTLESTVGHRLDNTAAGKTPCVFANDVADHPLGRAIRCWATSTIPVIASATIKSWRSTAAPAIRASPLR